MRLSIKYRQFLYSIGVFLILALLIADANACVETQKESYGPTTYVNITHHCASPSRVEVECMPVADSLDVWSVSLRKCGEKRQVLCQFGKKPTIKTFVSSNPNSCVKNSGSSNDTGIDREGTSSAQNRDFIESDFALAKGNRGNTSDFAESQGSFALSEEVALSHEDFLEMAFPSTLLLEDTAAFNEQFKLPADLSEDALQCLDDECMERINCSSVAVITGRASLECKIRYADLAIALEMAASEKREQRARAEKAAAERRALEAQEAAYRAELERRREEMRRRYEREERERRDREIDRALRGQTSMGFLDVLDSVARAYIGSQTPNTGSYSSGNRGSYVSTFKELPRQKVCESGTPNCVNGEFVYPKSSGSNNNTGELVPG